MFCYKGAKEKEDKNNIYVDLKKVTLFRRKP